jgi:3-deoxy-D-manno-octulosonic-acid transferase
VADQDALTNCLGRWLVNPTARQAAADAAAATIERLGGALDRTIAALEPYLMQLRLEQGVS